MYAIKCGNLLIRVVFGFILGGIWDKLLLNGVLNVMVSEMELKTKFGVTSL